MATVYVANEEIASGNAVATHRVDGKAVKLANSDKSSMAESIVVSSGNVYVAGSHRNTQSGHFQAMLWEDGVGKPLSDGTLDAYAIALSGPDAYRGGYDGDKAV